MRQALQNVGVKFHDKRFLNKKPAKKPAFAEREGFEPPVPHSTTVFKTAAIDHSAISPRAVQKYCNIFNLQILRLKNDY